jgi:hypothetical protein
MNHSEIQADVVEHFYNGIWNAEHQKRFKAIGNEINKVRLYANAKNTDADVFSQTIVWLTLSAYFSGLAPIIRIEGALFLASEFRNEYAYALAFRSYIEIAGRVHKGMRLWRQYQKTGANATALDALHEGVCRLMAKFRPEGLDETGYFKEVIGKDGKSKGGYNVMTLVDSIKDKLPTIGQTYDDVSTYIHGDLWEQIHIRKTSWFSDLKHEANPLIAQYEREVIDLREMVFVDFDELLEITKQFRERYDSFSEDEKNSSL